jgi:hypothetical protein
MGARRASILVASCVLLSMSVGTTGAVLAQADATDRQLCISVTGPAPGDGWDVLSLSVAIASGNATITQVGDASECGSVVPVEEPVAEEPDVAAEEPVTEEPDVTAEEPLPVEVEEAAIIGQGDQAAYYAILRNPNPSAWLARWMPVRVDLLDGEGELVSTYSNSVTLLPGQVGVIFGYPGDATGATELAVVAANGIDDWTKYADIPGQLSISQVKTKVKDSTIKTTGRISSSFEQQLEGVSITAVYRDSAGEVVGVREGYVEFIPADGEASFMVQSYSEKDPDIATTEVLLGNFLPPTG